MWGEQWLARTVLNVMLYFIAGERVKKPPTDIKSEKVSFSSERGEIPLVGWFFPSTSSNRCILIVPGGGGGPLSSRTRTFEIAKRLVEKNFNVLLFSLHGHGESGGKWTSQSVGSELRDVFGAWNYLIKGRGFQSDYIGILGFSIGAVATLLVAAEEKKIRAAVLESGWADFEGMFRKKPGEPKHWIMTFPFRWCTNKAGVKIPNPIEQLSQIRAKLFFIHGEKDEIISPEESCRLFQTSGGNEQGNALWIVKGASHCRSFQTNPEEYIERVAAFFRKYL